MSRKKPQTRPPKARMADATAPTRDGLQNVVAGLGTGRDKMAYSQYSIPNVLDEQTLVNMYRSSWLAKKVVNAPASDMTREWRTTMFDDDEMADNTRQFELEEAEKKFGVAHKFNEALKWSRLFGGSVILIGVGDPTQYDKPLEVEKIKKGDLRFLRVLDRHMCFPTGEYNWNDIESESFGLPMFYTIAKAQSLRIHHTRVIRFVGQQLPYRASMLQNQWGDSELQAVYDTLLGRDTITAAIATMMFESNVDVITARDLAELLSTKEGEAKLTKRFQVAGLMKSFNRMLLLDEGETYEKKSNSFSGLDSIMREFRAEVAGAADIPVSRLFGVSASGLNATGDNEVRNYYDAIKAKQNEILRPAIDQLDQVLLRHTFGNVPDDYRFEFNPLWQMPETERADIQKSRAERDQIYYNMGVLTEGSIAKQLKEDGTYNTMTTEDVELAEELSEMAKEAQEEGAVTDPANPEQDQGNEQQEGGQQGNE